MFVRTTEVCPGARRVAVRNMIIPNYIPIPVGNTRPTFRLRCISASSKSGPRKLSRDKRDSEEPLLLPSTTLSSCPSEHPRPRLLPDLPQATASPTPTPHSRYECPWQQHGISGSLYSERRPTSPDDRSWHAKIIGTSAVRFLGGAPRQLSRLRRCPSSFCRGYTKAALPFPYDCHRAHIE